MAAMHPEAARLFVQHGTRLVQQQQERQQHTEPPTASEQSRQHELQQQVELVCAPSVESAYYQALDPPPAVPLSGPGCPLLMLVAASPGSSAASCSTHAAVQQWLLQNTAGQNQQKAACASSATTDSSNGSSSRSSSSNTSHGTNADAGSALHAVLSVLNAELACSLPSAKLVELAGVSHFGPLEQPQLLAGMAAAFFQQQQQQQSKL
jgi:pimeloyl-ACP methyl ester carboxylesterase